MTPGPSQGTEGFGSSYLSGTGLGSGLRPAITLPSDERQNPSGYISSMLGVSGYQSGSGLGTM